MTRRARYACTAVPRRRGGVVTQRPAKPFTPVRFRSSPLRKAPLRRGFLRHGIGCGLKACPNRVPKHRARHRYCGDTGRAMSQENVEVVRRTYEAWNRRDFDEAAELLAPDIEWRMPSNLPD